MGPVVYVKQLGKTFSYLSSHGIKNYQELEARLTAATDKCEELNQRIKTLEAQIREKKDFQNHILRYKSNREILLQWQNMKDGKQKDAYYESHYSEIALATAAADYFRAHGIKSPLPSPKKVQAEIDDLISQKANLYTEYKDMKKTAEELTTVKYNVDEASRKNQQQKQLEKQRKHWIDR